MAAYDAPSVRGLYTSLSEGWTYLNAHSAPQVAERVSAGVARAFRLASTVPLADEPTGSHSAAASPGELEAVNYLSAAKVAVADLVGSQPDRVVLGPSLPVLYGALAGAMAPLLRRNASVVLSRLDAEELSAPFAAARPAEKVRWAQPDLATGELPAYQYADLVDGTTRLVTLSAAQPELGTVTQVADIVDAVRERSRAWTLVDVSSLLPYRAVTLEEMGADIVAVDLHHLGGPQLAALVFRDSAMLGRMHPLPTGGALPVSAGLAGGIGPLVDHYAALSGGETGARRKRLRRSYEELAVYMDGLRQELYASLEALPAVHILGFSGEAAAHAHEDRIPRLTFAVHGVPAGTVHQRLFDNGLITTLVEPQSVRTAALNDMGLDELGGAVTVGLGPFNTAHDIAQLTRVVASLA